MIGVENPEISTNSVSGAARVPLIIATNREVSEDPAIFFNDQRGGSLDFAKVDVSIPPSHKVGELEYPRRLPPDPRKNFVIANPEKMAGNSEFVAAVNRELGTRSPEDQTVLVFVHGYNTHLSSAILSTAQFVHDSGYKGVPILYSWPSGGRVSGYIYDLNSTLASRRNFQATMNALENTNTRGIDIVAHSLGNLLVMEAGVQAQIRGQFNKRGLLGTIILASADIDADVFEQQVKEFGNSSPNVYVLVSNDDRALALSRRVAGGVNRVGAQSIEELEKFGVTVIDLSNVNNTKSSTHAKFRQAPSIVQLIGDRLNEGGSLHANDRSYSFPLIEQLFEQGGVLSTASER
jgi:esterase/lipase superfamily enzyme